jgi:serine/threonine protein kinase
MNKNIIECIFELVNITNKETSNGIINSILLIKPLYSSFNYKYKINSYLGHGTVGHVYLLEISNNEQNEQNEQYVIKISNPDCKKDLLEELEIFKKHFIKNKIIYNGYPLFYGNFKNVDNVGIIYPYAGSHNFEKLKLQNYNIPFTYNIDIIIQIIKQLININPIIHCDLKPSNIVLDIKENKPFATIIDFGLSHTIFPNKTIVSTTYITSPESLLTMSKFNDCLVSIDDLKLYKHDYFGLYCFILNLFLNKSYWNLISNYLINDLKFNSAFVTTQECSIIYVYIWYKFNNINIKNRSLKNVILKIEKMYPDVLNKKYINFETFFKLYILPNLNLSIIKREYIILLYDFLNIIIKFDPDDRPELSTLLKHKFLQ